MDAIKRFRAIQSERFPPFSRKCGGPLEETKAMNRNRRTECSPFRLNGI